MISKTQYTLEFYKIISQAAKIAVSDIGKELLASELPATDFDTVEIKLSETAEAETILSSTGYYPISYFPDLRNVIKGLSAVYCLDIKELLDLALLLKVSREVKHLLNAGNTLQQYALKLADHTYIENEINRCILSDDEISDKASPLLNKIRYEKKAAEERIKEKILSYVKGDSQKFLQEQIYTVRNGRYVVPVRAEYKSYIPGLIHDQSSSGQTYYIEPAPIVELGNKLRTLLLDEQKEIQRILSSLTAMVASVAEELYNSIICLGHLDLLFSKAALARKTGAIRPKLNKKSYIHLINARHPLLDTTTVVPITVWIGDQFNTLIITGPNTGGKTVSLKTVGLLSMMAQAGYYIPADLGSELPVFKGIYADIGDEQSIEQSLSTFSSHMQNIVSMLKVAEPGSLILLDELGAGTDPSEGAALAQAILEYLNNTGAITFATTHYSEIKSFALAFPGMENASMEFDVEKMAPTYRMHIGIPGHSNAFEISTRLGISEIIIKRAKEFLTTNEITLEEILANAESNRLATERALQEANLLLEKAKIRETELQKEQEKLSLFSSSIKAKAREEARDILKAAKTRTDFLIEELRNTKGLDSSAVERRANDVRSKLRDYTKELGEELIPGNDTPVQAEKIYIGQILFSNQLQQNVEVLQLPDNKNEVLVHLGSIKTKLSVKDLSHSVSEVKKIPKVKGESKLCTQAMKMELDLRGFTVDDACMEIERYIDMCYMHSRKEFVLIHGKGTGALREGIHSYLKKCRSVEAFHIGAYGEGDAGVTVVKLKSEQ